MTKLDDFFQAPADTRLHPRLRAWKERIRPDTKAELELHRPGTAFGLSRTEMFVHFLKNGETQPPDVVEWEDELNAGLIDLGVKAVNLDQETERFALGLRAALRRVEREFGDGYLNAVLVDLLKDSDLTSHEEIASVLAHASANAVERTKSYDRCREMIALAISGRAVELTEKLGYAPEDARKILVRAIAQYLDERFSVSTRRRMGLL